MYERLTELYNVEWNAECAHAWDESKDILLHKGGHKSKYELQNYRPIALGDAVWKIFCAILNERLRDGTERKKIMGEEHNGFRRDRREDNIYAMNELIGRMKKDDKIIYIAFLNIENSYGRVNRGMMRRVLEEVGMSERVVNVIKSMYVNTRAKYILWDFESGWVRSRRGVRQGCILPPLLFGLYTEELAER